MNLKLRSLALSLVASSIPIILLTPATARADNFVATYLAPGVQTPTAVANYESFNNPPYPGTSITTNFGGSSLTGTYSGAYVIAPADQFGGAGGTGSYIYAPQRSSYTLSLASPANYFGLWFSALDSGNEVQFYSGSTLLYTFTPAEYISLVGTCPSSQPQPNFCGNPNSPFLGDDAGQQYAYLNFYDETSTFTSVTLSETVANGNFESDNQTAALLASGTTPVGTPVGATPEPGSLLLTATGLAFCTALLLFHSRRNNKFLPFQP